MNLIKRYIQAVKIELPSSQREDIRRELQSAIREELEALHEYAEAVWTRMLSNLEPRGFVRNIFCRSKE